MYLKTEVREYYKYPKQEPIVCDDVERVQQDAKGALTSQFPNPTVWDVQKWAFPPVVL